MKRNINSNVVPVILLLIIVMVSNTMCIFAQADYETYNSPIEIDSASYEYQVSDTILGIENEPKEEEHNQVIRTNALILLEDKTLVSVNKQDFFMNLQIGESQSQENGYWSIFLEEDDFVMKFHGDCDGILVWGLMNYRVLDRLEYDFPSSYPESQDFVVDVFHNTYIALDINAFWTILFSCDESNNGNNIWVMFAEQDYLVMQLINKAGMVIDVHYLEYSVV